MKSCHIIILAYIMLRYIALHYLH